MRALYFVGAIVITFILTVGLANFASFVLDAYLGKTKNTKKK